MADPTFRNASVAAVAEAIDFHVWNPSTRLCACGAFFEASLASFDGRKGHVAREALRAGLESILRDAADVE